MESFNIYNSSFEKVEFKDVDYNISASSVDSVAIGSKTISRFIAEDLNHFKIKNTN